MSFPPTQVLNDAVEFFVGVRLFPGVPAEQFADFAHHFFAGSVGDLGR
jgi:hypothetical protein